MVSPDAPVRMTEGISEAETATVEPVVVEASEGPGKGAKSTLTRGTFLVGSDKSCDLVLKDGSVSRRHLSVELLAGGIRVKDLGSRNGTFYLGARIQEAKVPTGGSIRVGKTTLRVVPAASEEELSEKTELGDLVGVSMPMRRLFALLERLAPKDSTVLISGETGAGKDAVARTLHALSSRKGKPFVVFDCAAVNPNLVESELFGHAKGAFTGAERQREGAVEAAQGGTLFLDEVGDLPLALQPKLLRFMETREFRRVGETAPRPSDVRVLAATHQNVREAVAEGRFRKDLYYRLAVAEVAVPPLRARADDIPLLAQRFAKELTGVEVRFAAPTLAALRCDPWPGNVRELRNAVERVISLGKTGTEPKESLAQAAGVSFKEARDELLDQFEHDYLAALLVRHRNNVSAAAREAKLSRTHFYRLLERHKLGTSEV